MILEFIQRYSYIVDFQRDIQPGDEFELFYEYTLNESGKKLSDGPLLYGNLISGGKSKSFIGIRLAMEALNILMNLVLALKLLYF